MSSKTIFFEDFSAPELDREKWNVFTSGRSVNNEQQAYVDSTETLYITRGEDAEGAETGALAIHPRYQPDTTTSEGETFDFISGQIHTRGKFDFTYGTAAARMKFPAGSGLWPAFCALGYEGKWPDCGEIDIVGYSGETDWVSAALHAPCYFGETPIFNKVYLSPENNATHWHVYSVIWEPDCFLFKIDDFLYYRVTRHMAEYYGGWPFDRKEYLLLNFALGGNFPFKINGVQKPYFGIPESTVQLIKDGHARVLVDWVKVTQS